MILSYRLIEECKRTCLFLPTVIEKKTEQWLAGGEWKGGKGK